MATRRHKPDYWLLILSALFLSIGFVVIYSISPGLAASQNVSQNYFITKQLVDVFLGLGVFAVAAFIPTSFWQKITKPLVVTAAVASLVVMFMPLDSVYQAHRWIRLGGLSFQVAELIKLALLVWAANFLAIQWRAGKLGDTKATLQPLLIALAAVGLVVAKFQSDLGSAGVMIAMLALMAYTVGVPLKKVALIGLAVLMVMTIAISSSSYRRERLTTFLHPMSDCQDSGYQACQALKSVGSGGLVGLGLGYSVQAYGYLPEAANDSIFAIIAEKFGFIGTLSIVTLYAVFITRMKKIAAHTVNPFSRLLVIGIMAWFSVQMIINIGSMIGLMPLKGITLPLISQGGTSIIFLTAALGMVFQISRYTSYKAIDPKGNYEQGPYS
ncbi:MAG: putative peptidoglycan glycosyltransferase FtsW, partial [Candidatus Saccharimonadales bacterium]